MGEEGREVGERGAGSGGRGGGKSVTIWVRNCFCLIKKLIENYPKRYHESSIRHIGHIRGPTMHTIRF